VKQSIMAETFCWKYTNIVSVNGEKAINWPAIQNILHGHSRSVAFITFSPNGSRIMSGSHDHTIRLWDTETGDDVGEPLEGHSHSVFSVTFSPDGSHIVSGSWDKAIHL
jgi:WD40 repeat protein